MADTTQYDSSIPYYLQPNAQVEATAAANTQSVAGVQFSTDPIVNSLEDKNIQIKDSSSLWTDIATSVDSGAGVAWDATKNAFVAVGKGVKSVGSSIASGAESVVSGAENAVGSVWTGIQKYLFIVFLGGLLLIYIIGKSGILGQAAAVGAVAV